MQLTFPTQYSETINLTHPFSAHLTSISNQFIKLCLRQRIQKNPRSFYLRTRLYATTRNSDKTRDANEWTAAVGYMLTDRGLVRTRRTHRAERWASLKEATGTDEHKWGKNARASHLLADWCLSAFSPDTTWLWCPSHLSLQIINTRTLHPQRLHCLMTIWYVPVRIGSTWAGVWWGAENSIVYMKSWRNEGGYYYLPDRRRPGRHERRGEKRHNG